MPDYPLPDLVTRDGRVLLGNTEHPGLSYYRFVPMGLENEQKGDYVRAFARRYAADGPWRGACEAHDARLAASAEAFRVQGRPVETGVRTTAGRLLIGMGYQNALEVGMTFHHPGGFPYLPGTSVKGLARAWAETIEKVDTATLKRVFGSEAKQPGEGELIAGSVVFLDAVPTRFPPLEADLLNPHAGAYYLDDTARVAPADWLMPVPVPFLAVGAGAPFRFTVVGRGVLPADTEAPTAGQADGDAALAWGWLMDALTDLGAGGKTAAGYGAFEPVGGATPILPLASERTGTAVAMAPAARPDAGTAFDGPPAELRPGAKGISARVVAIRDGKAWVRLHADGAEAEVKMEGQYRADGFPVGTVVLVEVWKDEWDKKAGRPRQVRFQKRLGP